MSAAPVVIVAPTDPQLDYITNLCAEHGWPKPPVYSKLHASLLIGEMRSGTYRPPEWDADEFADYDCLEDVPF